MSSPFLHLNRAVTELPTRSVTVADCLCFRLGAPDVSVGPLLVRPKWNDSLVFKLNDKSLSTSQEFVQMV